MPQLPVVLDRRKMGLVMKRGLRSLLDSDQVLRIKRIKVVRHKPGKRCLIEYKVYSDPPGDPEKRFSILGKIRAHRSPRTAFELQQQFWLAGFDDKSADKISVPEPIGMFEDLQIWFQRKIKGSLATDIITPTSGNDIAARIAEAAAKIHAANVPTDKRHTIADELRILDECFQKLSRSHPHLANRLAALFERCQRRAAALTGRPSCGIHRDFYSDQVLVSHDCLYVLDFDLYCIGDPALDIGNFVGHLTEQALRLHGHLNALRLAETALIDRFVELTSSTHRSAIEIYANLTLTRHIYLSSVLPDRGQLTEPLLALCEERI